MQPLKKHAKLELFWLNITVFHSIEIDDALMLNWLSSMVLGWAIRMVQKIQALNEVDE